MMTGRSQFILPALLGLGACQLGHDAVEPGYYGIARAGAQSKPTGATSNASVSSVGGAGSSAPPSPTPSPGASDGGKTTSASPSSAGGERAPAPPSSAGAPADKSSPMTAECDLSGKWLTTNHLTMDALGQKQYIHQFIYYEIVQQADTFTVKKGLFCGNDAIGVGDFAVTVDLRPSWAATMQRANFTGRTGTSKRAADGCMVSLAKWYTVLGATNPYYRDPAIPLPSADQKADGMTPGWEDWDNDGHPGITGSLSGVVSGKVFSAPRMWTQLSGTAPDVKARFKLGAQWGQEQNVMAYDGSPLLSSEGSRAADMSLHFAEFARLSEAQAAGDDTTLCKRVVELAPMLTPNAAASEL